MRRYGGGRCIGYRYTSAALTAALTAAMPQYPTHSHAPSPPSSCCTHTQVHKDVPRLLKGMLILGQDGGVIYKDDGTARPAEPITQVHACMRTPHTHTLLPSPLFFSSPPPHAPLLLPLSHLPQITALRKLMINLSTALDDPSITKLVEEQLPHYLNEDIGDVAGGLRHFLLESGVPEASLFVQVCMSHHSPQHTHPSSRPSTPLSLSYPHTLLPSPLHTHYR